MCVGPQPVFAILSIIASLQVLSSAGSCCAIFWSFFIPQKDMRSGRTVQALLMYRSYGCICKSQLLLFSAGFRLREAYP